MKHKLLGKSLLLTLALFTIQPTFAGLEEGMAAYNRKDYTTAQKELLPLAERGDAKAQYLFGEVYEYKNNKDGIIFFGLEEANQQNEQQAEYWYLKAAQQDNADAQNRLGLIYESYHGIKQDNQTAMEWFRKAAEQGHADGQINLGRMYLITGDNYQKAMGWYRKAAEQGSAEGQRRLGEIYKSGGNGVEKDFQKAVEWFTKAAERGDSEGQFLLGIMYKQGFGVDKDYQKALELFSKSAEQGNGFGELSLKKLREEIKSKNQ